MTTRSETVATEVSALLRARNPILWIVTAEEARVEPYLFEACAKAGYVARTWDVAQGTLRLDGAKETFPDSADIGDMLNTILQRTNRTSGSPPSRDAWILRDIAPWLDGIIGLSTCRQLANLARRIPNATKDFAQAIICLGPRTQIPPELLGHTTVVEWPLPDRSEIEAMLDQILETLPEKYRDLNGTREASIDAAVGLTGEQATACYSKSIVTLRKIDPRVVAGEKKRIISKERVLEWYDPIPGGLNSVGGLNALKSWLGTRNLAFSKEARAYGLPLPRGALLVGIPGCGKSLTAKAIATAWNIPLLRIDLGALKSKYVGESEGNLRRALRVIEAIGRCVVWLDEIEKALAGATQGAADGGVSSDALGAILSWMQERSGGAFVIATANDVTSLPPELLRKGRFDEIWSIDLPNPTERLEILFAALREYNRDATTLESNRVREIVTATEGFTGSEIAQLIPDALYTAFADGAREITIDDVLAACATVVPLSKTSSEKIAALRTWAAQRARPATSDEKKSETNSISMFRNLDLNETLTTSANSPSFRTMMVGARLG